MSVPSFKETIRRELPEILRRDPEFRAVLHELTREDYAGRTETEGRIERILDELRRDREEQNRKWDEQNRKWDEQNRKWDKNQAELQAMREEHNRKWEENQAELRTMREEHNRKWEAGRAEFDRVHEEIMAMARKHERSVGALGARWGLQSERSFRNALAAILEKNFGVQVRTVTEWDAAGEVFGRPDQVELDVIIRNGLLILCELKSSIDKAGMYSFERKARFYERRHGRQADRLIVISPMIDPRAAPVADRLGIETYGDSLEVEVS